MIHPEIAKSISEWVFFILILPYASIRFFLGQFWCLCYYVVLCSIPATFPGRSFLAHLDDTHCRFLLKDFLPQRTPVKSTSYPAKRIFSLACLLRLLSKKLYSRAMRENKALPSFHHNAMDSEHQLPE